MKNKSKKEKKESKTKSSKSNKVRLKVDPQNTIPYRQDAQIPKSREDKS